jgi:hypothetical protein
MVTLSYIYHDPEDTLPYWKGFSEDFDPLVTPIADKIASAIDLRAAGLKREDYIKFIMIIA